MKNILAAALALLLLTGLAPPPAPATGATLTLTPVFVRGGGTGTSVPAVSAASPVASSTAAGLTQNGQAIATLTASNSPTSWAIASCSGCTNYFAIDSSGHLTVTATGVSNIAPSSGGQTWTPVVNASNGAGTSGNVSIPVVFYDDGYLSRPSNVTAQYPTAFNAYSGVRPPWKVSGVDYGVGLDTTLTMTAWQSMVVSGCTVNSGASPPNVTCSGGDTTINQVDFSNTSSGGGNGAYIVYSGTGTLTLTNIKTGGSNYALIPSTNVIQTGTSSVGLTITGSELNGGCPTSSGASGTIVLPQGTGPTIFRYNHVTNRSQHVLAFNNHAGTLDYAFNAIEGGGCAAGSHANILEWNGGTATPTVRYILFFWGSQVYAGTQGEVIQFYQNVMGTMANPVLRNTVIIVPPGSNPGISYATHWWADAPTTRSGTAQMLRNYMDLGGNAGSVAFGSLYRAGLCSNTAPFTATGNIDLNGGGALAIGNVNTGGC